MDIQKDEAFELAFSKTDFYKGMVESLKNKDCPFESVFEIRNGKYRSSYVQLSYEIWQAAQAVPEQDQRIWATSNLTWKEVAFRALSCKVLKTTQNWVHVKNIASVGSTTASLICEKLGVNPDGTKFDLIKPQEQGHA